MNFHPRVIKNEDITNVLKILSKAVISQEGHMKEVLKKFEPYRELWDKDRDLIYEVDSCTSYCCEMRSYFYTCAFDCLFFKGIYGK